MSQLAVSLRLWNTDEYEDIEIRSDFSDAECEDWDYPVNELQEELAEELGMGIFDCFVAVDVAYDQCNHPLDPVEWDAEYTFELLGYKVVTEE